MKFLRFIQYGRTKILYSTYKTSKKLNCISELKLKTELIK